MGYLLLALEGIATFISPCLLPLLPVYISYFAGGSSEATTRKTMTNALGFMLGFSVLFVILGVFAGAIGHFLRQYQTAVNLVTGAIVILFGLNYLGVLNIAFLNKTTRQRTRPDPHPGFLSSALFGLVFAVGWTPCVGAFLGTALMQASQQGSAVTGGLMLLCFALGMGLPFILCALLIGQLKSAFALIKRHYRVINLVSGLFLIAIGLLMATGVMGAFLSLLTF